MVGFLKLELRRFADGLDVGVRERKESRIAGVFGAPAARRSELSSERRGRLRVGRLGRGWLFHVGLVRHEMSSRPLSGDDE